MNFIGDLQAIVSWKQNPERLTSAKLTLLSKISDMQCHLIAITR
jgi:hypothetical protein